MGDDSIIIRRVWRSQIGTVVVYIVLCVLSVWLSEKFPVSRVDGYLFEIFGYKLYATLPLFSLLPLAALVSLTLPIYDGYMTVDKRGVELRTGILSLRQKIIRVRYEDIRGVEIGQSLLERLLDYGTVGIGSAATESVEIMFGGVGSPGGIQDLIQTERDRRVRLASKNVISEVAVGD